MTDSLVSAMSSHPKTPTMQTANSPKIAEGDRREVAQETSSGGRAGDTLDVNLLIEKDKSISKNDNDDDENNSKLNNGEIVPLDLDHTSRKVIVYHVLKFMRAKEVTNMVLDWIQGHEGTIRISKYKKPPKANWVLVTLEHDDMVEPFLNRMNNGRRLNKRGGVLSAARANDDTPHKNSNGGKRSGRGDRDTNQELDGTENKRSKPNDFELVKSPDQVRDIITPLWRLSYEKQIDAKAKDMVRNCILKIAREIKSKFRIIGNEARKQNRNSNASKLYSWIDRERPIDMEPVMSAPKPMKYRNKCELNFGYRYEFAPSECEGDAVSMEATADCKDETEQSTKKVKTLKIPSVGFHAGGWSGGVSSPHCLQNIPDSVCGLADIVNEFLRTSPIPPYDARVHRGLWRQMTIRTSERTKECMLVFLHAPASGGAGKRVDGSDDYSEIFEMEKVRLVKMLTSGYIPTPVRDCPEVSMSERTEDTLNKCSSDEASDMRVTSIFFQEFDGLSNPTPDHPVQHVYGKESLNEVLGLCTFQISPGAFFQVTTEGAEVLYNVVVEKVKEVSLDPKGTLLFDVCCGTGTIGLTCMKKGAVGRVVGIDIAEPAIKDAIINAEKNGYSSAGDSAVRFVASRAESVMNDEIRRVHCPMVAVVDPARDGLHTEVVRALRNSRGIKRIVYVSCNPTGSLINDAALLCSPATKKYSGLPFKPTFAQPVDIFPLTLHCEMVMVFDRMSQAECNFTEDLNEVKKVDKSCDCIEQDDPREN